jgi:two-component system response regulator YesN
MVEQRQILIADDDPAVLFILRAAMEGMENGCAIVTAQSGAEALELVLAHPFDLVITDVRMPGLDGIELVEAMRASGLTVAVIWITGYGCYNLRAECERLHVYCCLDKPIRISEIRRSAEEALAATTSVV